jgi:hypothetical protein
LLLLVNAERVGEKMPIAQFRSNNQPEGKIHIASRSFIHPSSSIYRPFSGMYPTAAAIALL